ncbi:MULTISPECIES: undecaprenyl-phosphate glucose phosphotransferase [unclassified Bradyrhizobium]|uniref:undecaprenyl-phosphate glucose phosphotransferase n=1 Tax=unclassified Bradyrhizobium TaxID=2631580 RepID=UPI0024783768|nr:MULTISPECIES: undecaprenyl-phosphate glucose phosphotransferase [unclassified Bradyrhizobium]WGS18304.1 undecaprenyl-phosphate glucose phosphotransferase [Bradyrhizobium sp. ISRA463]WGS25118.1 undecaprenyl-phosphate glucose phosphotransferase [Bradyrhizobium sp. ISRA464]
MSATAYGSDGIHILTSNRGTSLQRPFQLFVIAGDFLLILLSYMAASTLYRAFMNSPTDPDNSVGAGLIVGIVFVVAAYFQGTYDNHRLLNTLWQSRKVLFTWLFALTTLAVAAFLLKSTANLSRGTIILFTVIGALGLVAHRVIWRYCLSSSFAKERLIDRKVIMLSLRSLDFTSNRFKDLRKHGFDVVRHFVLSVGPEQDDRAWSQQIADVIRQSRAADVDEYLVAIDWNELPMLQKLSQHLRVVPQPIRLLPDFPIADLVSRPFLPVSGTVAIEIQRPPLSVFERVQKRCLDIGLASFALLMLAPLILTAALLVKLDTPGPIIFRQSRRGFNGKPFQIWKFRSMTVAENGSTVTQATKQDKRVTRVGRFLRKTSIDELPQLWNVLRGEMSLVGPRPHALAHDNYYDQLISKYVYRHHMKPGLTGWAQVNGFRGETPTIDLMEKRVEYDVWYVSNWSIWLDIRIIIRTATALMYQEAY